MMFEGILVAVACAVASYVFSGARTTARILTGLAGGRELEAGP